MKGLSLVLIILGIFISAGTNSALATSRPSSTVSFSQETAILPLSINELNEIIDQNNDKAIIINIFATWCGPCRSEIPDLVKARKALPDDKVLFIGLSIDSDKNALQNFVSSKKINYPVYIDNGSIAKNIGVYAIPLNLILAPGNILYLRHEGSISEQDLYEAVEGALSMDKEAAAKAGK